MVALFGPVMGNAEAAAVGRSTPRAVGSVDDRGLADGFLNPPLSARPAAYWAWLNGNVSLPQLTRELEEMKHCQDVVKTLIKSTQR